MRVASESFNRSLSTLSGPTAVGSPTSNIQFVTTTKDGTGVAQDLIVPDVYLIRVIQDADHDGTAFSEVLSVVGKPADTSVTNWDYPKGTGVDATIPLLDPAVTQGIVTDPSFDEFTVANTPDQWTLVSGTVVTTNITSVTDDARDGADGTALSVTSSAGATYKLRQQVTLEAGQVYAAHFKYKPVANGSATAASVIPSIHLVDSSGTIINDDAGTANSLTGSAHSVVTTGSGWNHGYSGVFITPNALPDEVYLEIRFVADATGANGYFDHVNLALLSPLYTGGPYLAGWSGTSEAVFNDTWTLTVTLTSGTMSGYMIRHIDRLLDLKGLGVRLATSASPTILDALIV
jgi:hypothetical protein